MRRSCNPGGHALFDQVLKPVAVKKTDRFYVPMDEVPDDVKELAFGRMCRSCVKDF